MECILESSESSGSSSSLPNFSNNSKHPSEPESDTNAQNGQSHQTYTLIIIYQYIFIVKEELFSNSSSDDVMTVIKY